jgi:hypothetical protein
MMNPAQKRTAINGFIAGIVRKPFEWGQHDCAVGLAFPVIELQTGLDLGAPFRGTYDSLLSGMKAFRRAGYETGAHVVAAHFNEVHPAFAQFGDIAIIDEPPENWAFAVVLGERLSVLAPSGAGTIPRSRATRAFSIKEIKQ